MVKATHDGWAGESGGIDVSKRRKVKRSTAPLVRKRKLGGVPAGRPVFQEGMFGRDPQLFPSMQKRTGTKFYSPVNPTTNEILVITGVHEDKIVTWLPEPSAIDLDTMRLIYNTDDRYTYNDILKLHAWAMRNLPQGHVNFEKGFTGPERIAVASLSVTYDLR